MWAVPILKLEKMRDNIFEMFEVCWGLGRIGEVMLFYTQWQNLHSDRNKSLKISIQLSCGGLVAKCSR